MFELFGAGAFVGLWVMAGTAMAISTFNKEG